MVNGIGYAASPMLRAVRPLPAAPEETGGGGSATPAPILPVWSFNNLLQLLSGEVSNSRLIPDANITPQTASEFRAAMRQKLQDAMDAYAKKTPAPARDHDFFVCEAYLKVLNAEVAISAGQTSDAEYLFASAQTVLPVDLSAEDKAKFDALVAYIKIPLASEAAPPLPPPASPVSVTPPVTPPPLPASPVSVTPPVTPPPLPVLPVSVTPPVISPSPPALPVSVTTPTLSSVALSALKTFINSQAKRFAYSKLHDAGDDGYPEYVKGKSVNVSYAISGDQITVKLSFSTEKMPDLIKDLGSASKSKTLTLDTATWSLEDSTALKALIQAGGSGLPKTSGAL